MTDQELLEKAAARAGYTDLVWCEAWGAMARRSETEHGFIWGSYWNPLRDAAQALYLAIECRLIMNFPDVDHGDVLRMIVEKAAEE